MSAAGVALRIARRDALRYRGRSLLILALIALPVLAVVAIDVLFRSSDSTPAEQVRNELAGSDAWLIAPQGVAELSQDRPGWPSSGTPAAANGESLALRPPAEVLALLPPGSQVTPWQEVVVPVLGADGRYQQVRADLLDITAPAAGERYRVTAGVAPTADDEVAITADLAAGLGLRVGDRVRAGAPARDYRLVGLVSATTGGKPVGAIVALPGAIPSVTSYYGDRYLVRSPLPITWDMLQGLNSHGIAGYSRASILGPGAAPADDPGQVPQAVLATAGGIVVVAMLVLQVVFLAGPAFAVGARRMRRQLGQLVAAGAAPRHVRWVVLASGLVFGVVGSVTGALLGIGLALAIHPLLTATLGMPWWALHLHVDEIGIIAVAGVGTAVLAALFPALSAGRTHPVALLGRLPASPRSAGWLSIAGAIGCAAGVVITVITASRPIPTPPPGSPPPSLQGRGYAVAAGMLLTELGLIMATPLILQLAARLGGRLPTVGRLALRDAARHRGRTAPAVAAIMAAASLAVGSIVFLTTIQRDHAAQYVPAMRIGQVNVGLSGFGPAPAGATPASTLQTAQQAIDAEWPGSAMAVYGYAAGVNGDNRQVVTPPENECPWFGQPKAGVGVYSWSLDKPGPSEAELPSAAHDWRCAQYTFSELTDQQAGVHIGATINAPPSVMIGGPELRAVVTGMADPEADAALAAGKAVVLDRSYLSAAGTVDSAVVSYDDSNDVRYSDIRSVPAVLGTWSAAAVGVILPPSATSTLGLGSAWSGIVVQPPSMPSDAGLSDLTARLAATAGVSSYAWVERGYYPYGDDETALVALVLVVACLLIAGTLAVVTALGIADAGPDLATLAAVGAPPSVRRLLSGFSAGLIAALGCVLGVALGMVPAYGVLGVARQLGNTSRVTFAVPWTPLVIVGAGLPVAAFLIGVVVTRSRMPMVARIE